MILRIFDATPKRTPGLSTNFSRRRTRNFMCPALHFLSFADTLTLLSSRGPVCEVFQTNVNLSGKDKKIRAGHLKFLVRLKKLLETRGVRGCVSSKMRDFIRRNIRSWSFETKEATCISGLLLQFLDSDNPRKWLRWTPLWPPSAWISARRWPVIKRSSPSRSLLAPPLRSPWTPGRA